MLLKEPSHPKSLNCNCHLSQKGDHKGNEAPDMTVFYYFPLIILKTQVLQCHLRLLAEEKHFTVIFFGLKLKFFVVAVGSETKLQNQKVNHHQQVRKERIMKTKRK